MIKRLTEMPTGQFIIVNIALIGVLIPIFFQIQKYKENEKADVALTTEATRILDDFLRADPASVALMEAKLAVGSGTSMNLEQFRMELSEPERYEAVRMRLISKLRQKQNRRAYQKAEVEPRKQSVSDIIKALGTQAD